MDEAWGPVAELHCVATEHACNLGRPVALEVLVLQDVELRLVQKRSTRRRREHDLGYDPRITHQGSGKLAARPFPLQDDPESVRRQQDKESRVSWQRRDPGPRGSKVLG